MGLQEEVELLRRIPLFAETEPSKLKLLAFTSERVSFDAEQVLFSQGDPANAAYIIIEGEADVLVSGPSGPIRVATLGKHDFVGEIGILCEVPRTAMVKANTRLTTLRISKELFFRLLREFPHMAISMMRELAHRLEQTNSKLQSALTEVDRLKKAS